MNISKIKLMEANNNKQSKASNYKYNPMYLKNNELGDSVNFTGKGGRSFRKEVAARVGAAMLAISSILGGCTNQKPVQTPVVTSNNAAVSEADVVIPVEDEIVIGEDELAAEPIQLDFSKLAPSSVDYALNITDNLSLNNFIGLNDVTASSFQLNQIPAVKRFNSDNIGSATVITTINNKRDISSVEGSTFTIPEDVQEGYSVLDLINSAYKELSENEKNSAAWAVMDNSEEVLEKVNQNYLTYQLVEQFKNDLNWDVTTKGNIPEYAMDVIKNNFAKGEAVFAPLYNDDELNAMETDKYNEYVTIYNELTALSQKLNTFKTIDEATVMDEVPPEIIFTTDVSSLKNLEVVTPSIYTLSDIGRQGNKFIQSVGFPSRWYDLELKGNKDLSLDDAKTAISNEIGKQYAGKDGKQLLQDKDGNYILSSYAGQNILKTILLDAENNSTFDGEIINNANDVITVLAQKMINGEDIILSTPDTSLSFIYKNQLNDPVSYAVAQRKVELNYLHVSKAATSFSQLQKIAQEEGRQEPVAMDLLNFVEYKDTSLKKAIENAKGTSRENEMTVLGASAIVQLADTNPVLMNNIIANAGFTPKQLLEAKIDAPLIEGESKDDYTIQLENIVYMNEPAAPVKKTVKKKQPTPTPQVVPPKEEEKPTEAPTILPFPEQTEAPKPTPKPGGGSSSGGGGGRVTTAPTSAPTSAPTDAPTSAPTSTPTSAPTSAPTDAPTSTPTSAPTDAPTDCPTGDDVPITPDKPPVTEDIPGGNIPDTGVEIEGDDDDDKDDDCGDITQGGTTTPGDGGNIPDTEVGIEGDDDSKDESGKEDDSQDKTEDTNNQGSSSSDGNGNVSDTEVGIEGDDDSKDESEKEDDSKGESEGENNSQDKGESSENKGSSSSDGNGNGNVSDTEVGIDSDSDSKTLSSRSLNNDTRFATADFETGRRRISI